LDLLEIKALHFGVAGSLDTQNQWFIGVGLRMQF